MTSHALVAPPSSAATASRSPARTARTRTRPTRTCSPPRIDGLVARFGLQGERLGEVAAGAVLKHSRDFNLTRESVLGSRLAPTTPAYDVQQACGTGPGDGDPRREQDRARPDRVGHRRRRRHHLGRADRGQRGPARGAARRSTGPRRSAARLKALGGLRPGQLVPGHPAEQRAAHRPVDGRAPGDHHARVGHHPRGAGRARRRVAPATSPPPTTAASSTTWSPRSSA